MVLYFNIKWHDHNGIIICKSGWPSWSNAMSKITNITNININYTMTSLIARSINSTTKDKSSHSYTISSQNVYGGILRRRFCPPPGRYATFLDRANVPAISSEASNRLSSIKLSPATVNAFERRSAAWESPEEEMMAAFLYCSACGGV